MLNKCTFDMISVCEKISIKYRILVCCVMSHLMCFQFVTHLVCQPRVQPCLYSPLSLRDIAFRRKIDKQFLCQNADFLIIFLSARFSVCKFVCPIFNAFFCLSDLSITSVLWTVCQGQGLLEVQYYLVLSVFIIIIFLVRQLA